METLSDIGDLLSKLTTDFSGLQSFVAFILLLVLAFFHKQIPSGLKFLISLFKKKEKKKPKTFRHDIFTLLDETSLKSETMTVKGKEVKTVMFRDAVLTKITITKKRLEELVNKEGIYTVPDPELLSEIDIVLNNITKDFNIEYRRKLKSQGLTQSDIAFILSYLSPERVRNVDVIKKRCAKIFISDYYPENQEKIVSFLEIMAFTVETLLPLTIKAFELMNGRFDKYVYDRSLGRYRRQE